MLKHGGRCCWHARSDQCFFVLQPYCGLPITTYFSAVKLRWLLDNSEAVQKAVKEGRCLFGTVDSWIMWVRAFIQVCFRKWFWLTFYSLRQTVCLLRETAFDCCHIWSYDTMHIQWVSSNSRLMFYSLHSKVRSLREMIFDCCLIWSYDMIRIQWVNNNSNELFVKRKPLAQK